MNDTLIVEREACALGRACLASSTNSAADALVSAILGLPQDLLRVVMKSLLDARELPELLERLRSVLQRALLRVDVQQCGSEAEKRASSLESDCARDGEGGNSVAAAASLHLRAAQYSEGACAAMAACIPLLPQLNCAICEAPLPAALLLHALSVHTALTRLDLSGAGDSDTCVSARALAESLPSWPGLRSLRIGHSRLQSPVAAAAMSNIIAPALAGAIAQLHLSRVHITPELACGVGALAQLASLHLRKCRGAPDLTPHLPALPHLHTLCAQGLQLQHTAHPSLSASRAEAFADASHCRMQVTGPPGLAIVNARRCRLRACGAAAACQPAHGVLAR